MCCMGTDRFIVYIKTNDIYKDIADNVKSIKYELDGPSSEKKKVIGLMKDELGRKFMTKFVGLRAKSCSYLIDDGSEDKKAKDTKKCVIKRKLKFKIIKTV